MNLSVFPFKELDSKKVHIWTIDTSIISDKHQHTYYNLLSDDEKLRANKFRFEKDYKTSVIARGILRKLSGYYLSINPKQIEFKYEKFGKPQYKNYLHVKFNVSHSGNFIIIGFTKKHEFGVDVEYIKNDFDVLDIAQNFFSKMEIQELKSLPNNEQELGFYRCWTRKESFIKAKGSGLTYPLDSFSVSLNNDFDAKLKGLDLNPEQKENWSMFSFKPHENYIAAISVKNPIATYQLFSWQQGIQENNSIFKNSNTT